MWWNHCHADTTNGGLAGVKEKNHAETFFKFPFLLCQILPIKNLEEKCLKAQF
jgi:hypothetical protein